MINNDLKINELLNAANNAYNKAAALKDKARISKDNTPIYEDAAKAFGEASEIRKQVYELDKCPSIINIECKIFNQYYQFEKEDCLTSFFYERHDVDEALKHHELSSDHLKETIHLIEANLGYMSDTDRVRFFIERLNLYKYFLRKHKAKRISIKARAAWDSQKYIEALDLYREHANELKAILDKFPTNIPPEYRRIASGNHSGALKNAASMLARMAFEHKDADGKRALPTDLADRFIKYTLEAYRIGNQAYHANPEWENYRQGAELCKSNIQSFLREYPNSWTRLLIEFGDDPEFVKFMKETDIKRYKEVVLSLSPADNKPIRLWSIGSFFILLVVVVSFIIYQIASSNFSLFRLLLVFGVLETIVVLSGTFILKATGDLSENSFTKVIMFALRNQLQFFKFIGKKKAEDKE